MFLDMTIQVRVTNMEEGQAWYEKLLKKKPDFIPHEGFVEWELIPGCWLQVAEGTPIEGNGPIRLGVTDIVAERARLIEELNIDSFEIHSRQGVPVKRGTFKDPWGNLLGLYEYLDKHVEQERIKEVLGANKS